jgi:uncharacterized membrane protein YidH (DUF202 family)
VPPPAPEPAPAPASPDGGAAQGDYSTVNIVGTGNDVWAAGATVNVTGNAKSVAAAAANVSIAATVAEDVWAAGASVVFDGTAGGKVRALAGNLKLRGRAASVMAAGGTVDAEIATSDSVKIGGGQVKFGPATDIAGSLYVGAGNLALSGHIARDVKIAADAVAFNARADGNVTIEGEVVAIGPNAIIGGDLILLGDTRPTVDAAATITGRTRNEPSGTWFVGPKVDPTPGQYGFGFFIAGTAILTGILLMLLGRANFDEAASQARRRPVSRFIVGLLAVILIPVIAGVVALTIIGIPLAIGLILFIPFLLLIGHATVSLGIADWLFNRGATPRGMVRSVLFLILGAIILAIVGIIPVVGPPIVGIMVLLGAGAFLSTLHARLRRAVGM